MHLEQIEDKNYLEFSLPLALPTIFAGINQTIMMALAMVVIASMIGVKGLRSTSFKSNCKSIFYYGLIKWFSNCRFSDNF
jgi:ABC-type proline/glycine betaine transport system permease subunit